MKSFENGELIGDEVVSKGLGDGGSPLSNCYTIEY